MRTIIVSREQKGADFTSIQAAIEAAASGDTVFVAGGLYGEQLTINKPLTLLGAGSNIDPSSDGRTEETIIESEYPITITQDGAAISGFEFKGFKRAISIASSAEIKGIAISYSLFRARSAHACIDASANVRNFAAVGNIIRMDGEETGAAIRLAGVYENALLSRNDIDAGKSACISAEYSSLINGMKITANHFRSQYSVCSIGNILSGSFVGNAVEGSAAVLGIKSGTISGNSFINGGHLELLGDGYVRPSSDLKVTNNLFSDTVFGRGLKVRAGAHTESIIVSTNAFLNSGIRPSPAPDHHTGYLIVNEGEGMLDASLNWWGESQGPLGSAGGIAGSVVTLPWITIYESDPESLNPPAHLPLSAYLPAKPGFWPFVISGIKYIGSHRFSRFEEVVLAAQVKCSGGDGSGHKVRFKFDGKEYFVRTHTGGVAYVSVGRLKPGKYLGSVATNWIRDELCFAVSGRKEKV